MNRLEMELHLARVCYWRQGEASVYTLDSNMPFVAKNVPFALVQQFAAAVCRPSNSISQSVNRFLQFDWFIQLALL